MAHSPSPPAHTDPPPRSPPSPSPSSSSSSAASTRPPSPQPGTRLPPPAAAPVPLHSPQAPAHPPPPHPAHHPAYLHARDLTHYLEATFVPSVVPQPDEYQAKELARQYLERLAAQVSPGAKLLPFGSVPPSPPHPSRTHSLHLAATAHTDSHTLPQLDGQRFRPQELGQVALPSPPAPLARSTAPGSTQPS